MAMAASSTRRRISQVRRNVRYNSFIPKLLLRIYDHLDEHNSVDVTFKLSNPYALVPAHRLILSAACPYFKQLFKSEAGSSAVIEITDIDSDTFQRFIKYCYTGKKLITIDNVGRMLKAALILQLDDVVTSCVDFLIDHIKDYTLERALILESETQCALLTDKIFEYETENFMDLMQTDEFLKFDFTKLQMILKSDDLNVVTVADASEAINRWYEHDPFARKQKLPDLISCLRCVESRTKETIAALNWKIGECSCSIFKYNKDKDSWIKWADIKMAWSCFEVIFMNDNLIFCGGKERDTTLEVCSWNLKTKIFQKLPSMARQRYLHCMAVLNDNLYAIGGRGMCDDWFLGSVEMYSASSNEWKFVACSITARANAAAVTYNGKIYIFGGNSNRSYCEADCQGDRAEDYVDIKLKSVECYDPTTDSWTQCADMTEPRCDHGAVVHGEYIYVVGGFNESENWTILERYDPRKDKWTKISDMDHKTGRMGCVSIDGKLWTVGAQRGDVSFYDGESPNWNKRKGTVPCSDRYYCFSTPKTLLLRPICTEIYTNELDYSLPPFEWQETSENIC